ncbi:hypothetical protein ACFSTI_02125 [Rhizorhabdus histidinilytica]|uniref:Extracellular solute-binding protein n=1 Tax=Rhizorhabdus histidinilytica TaxID=439228 RepID=A0A1T5B834_9SPHN|nr:hypothetical protein [Rhizorhabdus histidinilytica]SKB43454.1 hypothetical protein SAMN06295920_102586 [Rhizorhabdus histidinilytica]
MCLKCPVSLAVRSSLGAHPPSEPSLVEAAWDEHELLVYADIEGHHWGPAVAAFGKLYPWLRTRVRFVPDGPHRRYREEIASAGRSADLVIAASPAAWAAAAEAGETAGHRSVQLSPGDAWSAADTGIFAVSADPVIVVGPADAAANDGARTIGTDGTIFAEAAGEALVLDGTAAGRWPIDRAFDHLLADAAGSRLLVPAHHFFSRTAPAYRERIGWSFTPGKTVVIVRKVGLMRRASHPNAARLMIDFLLSHEGQVALARGGLTPCRADITGSDVSRLTFGRIVEQIGRQDVILLQ